MRAIVTVIGRDQVGIIAFVCSLLSEQNVNVLDISQTVLQDYFTMIMLVDASAAKLPFSELAALLSGRAQGAALTSAPSGRIFSRPCIAFSRRSLL